MGELMREYWIPACLPQELEPDATPTRLKLLGEKLIAFRDTRAASASWIIAARTAAPRMFFGRNEEGGLRCVYHGWKFDVEGNCLDMPNVPDDQRFTEQGQGQGLQGGRAGGIVWVYMGKREVPPPLPALEVCSLPADERIVMCHQRDCNWLQALEGDIDTSHFGFLHVGAVKPDDVDPNDHASLGPGRPRAALPCQGDGLGHDVHGLSPGRSRQPSSIASPTSCSRASRWCRTAPSAT